MTDRLPYDTTLDGPDEPREPRPERDPDEARDQLLDDVRDGLREAPDYFPAVERQRRLDAEAEREARHRSTLQAAVTYSRSHYENLHNPRG